MRKWKHMLTVAAAAALMSTLFAVTAMAEYELYDVEWRGDSDYDCTATWDDDDIDYGSYQVKLMRDDDEVTELTTSSQHHNFENNITRTGSYYFKVRVRFGSDDEGEWYDSDELDVDEDFLHHIHGSNYDHDDDDNGVVNSGPASVSPGPSASAGPGAAVAAGWHQNTSGQWYYINTDGSYPRNAWDYINNEWYYFNANGIMETGWIHSADGNWYYCNPSTGAMETNTWTPDGYYVNAEGIWQQGITP